MTMPLNNLRVVVTRPEGQADSICERLHSCGAEVIRLPLIKILAVQDSQAAQQTLQKITDFDCVIFISRNAVDYGLRLGGLAFTQALRQHKVARIGAIGQPTAAALQAQQIPVNLRPAQGFTSEDFLALPAMQQLAKQRILIVRGEGGRELLAQTLKQRGAVVKYAEVYQRSCPVGIAAPALQPSITHCTARPADVILLTSSESLRNLLALLGDALWLKQTVLIAGSQRIANDALAAEFITDVIVAADPSDSAMLSALLNWQQEAHND